MGDYAKVKSKFIRDKIKNCKWGKKKYIDDLMRIEQSALGQSFGWLTGYIQQGLENTYPKEWKIIHLEINPKAYKDNIKRKKREALEEKREETKERMLEKKEREQDKKDWKKMGGRI